MTTKKIVFASSIGLIGFLLYNKFMSNGFSINQPKPTPLQANLKPNDYVAVNQKTKFYFVDSEQLTETNTISYLTPYTNTIILIGFKKVQNIDMAIIEIDGDELGLVRLTNLIPI